MSLDELSQQRIITYESFIEFLKREWNYPVNEDIAKAVYEEYIDERKKHESSLSILDHHKYVLNHYSIIYGIKSIMSDVKNLQQSM